MLFNWIIFVGRRSSQNAGRVPANELNLPCAGPVDHLYKVNIFETGMGVVRGEGGGGQEGSAPPTKLIAAPRKIESTLLRGITYAFLIKLLCYFQNLSFILKS